MQEATATKQFKVDEMFLRRFGLRMMRYYRDQVIGTAATVYGFVMDGLMSTEGAERERFANLLCAFECGDLILDDDPDFEKPEGYYKHPKLWKEWRAEEKDMF